MANWGELQGDILFLIANRIDLLDDFVAFGMVCTTWRSAAIKENFNISLQQVPWLMLAEREKEDDGGSDMRDFYDFRRGGLIHRVMLPEAREKRCMESLGWLVTASKEGEMSLLHPLSRAQIALPHQNTFKYHEELWMEPVLFIWKAVLSSRPSCSSSSSSSSQAAAASDSEEEGDCVLMVVHGGGRHLGFCRPGDRTWTVIETRDSPYSDIAYYRGQFYAVDNQGKVVACDVRGPNPTVASAVGGIPTRFTLAKQLYLVESAAGALLVVARDGVQLDGPDEDHLDYGTFNFEVFEVDLSSNGGWKEIKDLGNTALFLGHSASSSVDASKFPGIKRNCIYYTDDSFETYSAQQLYPDGGGKDMGIYSLEDGNREPLYQGESFSFICPPVWVSASF